MPKASTNPPAPLPTIRIGSTVYAIREVPDLDRDHDCHGLIDLLACEIRLSSNLRGQFRRRVLWHEALHGVLYSAGLQEYDNERVVEALAETLPRLIQDNPWLVADLLSEEVPA